MGRADDPWSGWTGDMPEAPAFGERQEPPAYWRGWTDGYGEGQRSGAGVFRAKAHEALSAIEVGGLAMPKSERTGG